MKKIPFDLELAKRGDIIYMEMDYTEYHLVAALGNKAWLKWDDKNFGNKSAIFTINGTWHHLIPDEPKPERWAVVEVKEEFDNDIDAKSAAYQNNKIFETDKYTVVKLADDE